MSLYPISELAAERDMLRSEVERLKQALHDASIENSGQAALLERTREKVITMEFAAANSEIEKLNKDIQKHSDNNMYLIQKLAETFIELDKARDEIAKLKAEAKAPVVKELLTTRLEPSRLEIAAMLLAGSMSDPSYPALSVDSTWFLQHADKLIAASKEVAK